MKKVAMRFRPFLVMCVFSSFFFSGNAQYENENIRDKKILLNENGMIIRVAPYKDDKVCAISYTFDDGLVEHYTLLFPELEKRGFKGTLWVNGSKINQDSDNIADTTRMTWIQLKEMADKGHEISNHGWAHKNFGRFSLEEIKEDITKNDSAIFVNIGIMPTTFCYPNNNKSNPEAVEFVSENRVGTRTEQRSIGSKSTPEGLDRWVETLIETRDWGVGMTHGLTYGYDAFGNPQRFWDHLDEVKSQEDKIWVATFKDVAAYLKERENFTWKLEKKKDNIVITPELSLDKKIFTESLTMVIENPKYRNITVKQENKELLLRILSDRIMFDFDPFGGVIQIFGKR